MSERVILQQHIDEYRNRGIHFDEVKALFIAGDVEQPKQWRSVPNIIAHLSEEKLKQLLEKSKIFLDNQKIFNDKLVVLYTDLSEEQLNTIDQALSTVFNTSEVLEYSYSTESIANISNEEIVSDSLKFFKFKKVRSVFLKEDIDFETLNEETKAEFIEFDKIVGVKAKNIVCFDSVVIDKENQSVILQLDLVSLLRSGDVDKNLDLFQIMVNKVIANKSNNLHTLDKKANVLNLYGCIKNFYDKSEGAITKLSFTTSKGVHHETLKGAATDIRTADYHLGGKAREGTIYPYRVTNPNPV